MPQDKVYIVGVAPGGATSLPPKLCRILSQAEIVFGGDRLLEMFPSLSGEKVVIKDNLAEVAGLIKANQGKKRMVVLASGDPGFYGIARYLTGKLGKDVFEIIPNVSAMQVAFARIGESWGDAVLTSVHSRPIEDIIAIVRSGHKIGMFTDDKHTPGEIARVLLGNGIDNCRAYVCQDLGSEAENIVTTDLYHLKEMVCSPLNVMILIRDTRKPAPAQQLLGIAEEGFQQPGVGGIITKLEVRAVSLAKLCLSQDSIVWDIGAGSGAVSIEASLLAGRGSVFAVEKNSEAVAAIRQNIRRFGRRNVKVIHALAPDSLERLPAPTAVFVGGSGGNLAEIVRLACVRLQPAGRIVINAATLETMHGAVEGLKASGFTVEIAMVNVARSRDILDLTRFEALNPVFVITGWKSGERSDAE